MNSETTQFKSTEINSNHKIIIQKQKVKAKERPKTMNYKNNEYYN